MIFYGMNWNGVKEFYRYDLEENTIQRYFQDIPGVSGISSDQYQDVVGTYSDLLHDYDMRGIVIIFLGVVCAGLVVTLIVVLKKKGGKPKTDDGGKPEKKSRRKPEDHLAAAEQAASRETDIRKEEPEEEALEENRDQGSENAGGGEGSAPEEVDFQLVDLDSDDEELPEERQENKDEDDDIELIDL